MWAQVYGIIVFIYMVIIIFCVAHKKAEEKERKEAEERKKIINRPNYSGHGATCLHDPDWWWKWD